MLVNDLTKDNVRFLVIFIRISKFKCQNHGKEQRAIIKISRLDKQLDYLIVLL